MLVFNSLINNILKFTIKNLYIANFFKKTEDFMLIKSKDKIIF